MRLRILIALALFVGTFFVMAQNQVQAATTVTPEIITRIRNRCVENQATLNRLHQTDAFLRNDRGNLYRTISDKLMVPLNKRLASNQQDGGALVTIAADFNQRYSEFYRAYIDYDNSLSKLLEIDCDKEPVAFYNSLLDARTKRTELSKINQSIKDLVRLYGTTFSDFRASYTKENA